MEGRSSFLALMVFAMIDFATPSAQSAEFNRSDPALPLALQFIPASDARFRYEGRIDFGNSEAPVVIWEGSRIAFDFEGSQLFLRWGQATGQNFFDVKVDGENEIIGVMPGAGARIVWPRPLAPGRHRLTLFKRSEASVDAVFAGLPVANGISWGFNHRWSV
jgi:hypothetical protein